MLIWPRWYQPPKVRSFYVGALIQEVANDFGVSAALLTSDRKPQHIAYARAVVSRILRDRAWSLTRIGQVLGGRDHKTIKHAIDHFDVYRRMDERVSWSYETRRLRA